jgi:predicted phosphodiesterase
VLIATISDLHLGYRDEAELFQHEDGAFLRFLDYLESNFERVVLLGDIWETLTGYRYRQAADALKRCRESHPRLAARFERPAYTFVHGNHDIVAGQVEQVPEEVVIDDRGFRLLFTHGHQSDPVVMNHQWLTDLGVWVGGWIRRAKLGAIYSVVSQYDRTRSGDAADPEKCAVQRYAVDLARERGADVVVTGHTHVATRVEHGDTLFLNGGSCAEGYSYAAIDTRSGTFDIDEDWTP